MTSVIVAEKETLGRGNRDRDCSALPFDKMPVIERTPDAVIVRCSEYRREK